jgi:carbamoyl-phosphate synthase large subunit
MPPTKQEFLFEILDGCIKNNITIILPTRDEELIFWSENIQYFNRANIHVVISPASSIVRCLDKLDFSKFGILNHFPFIPSSKFLEKIDANSFVVKERFGSGSKNIGINLNRDEAMRHAKNLKFPIFQPYITGVEISVDGWIDKNHKTKGVVLRRRELIVKGESQVTTTFQDQNIESRIIQILDALELNGPVVMQAFLTSSKDLFIIECNPRFGGASTASILAGLDSFLWSIAEYFEGNTNPYPFKRRASEIRQVRIPWDIGSILH